MARWKLLKIKERKQIKFSSSSNLNFNVSALCSVKPLYNIATKKEKSMDVAAFYEGNSVSAVAPEGTSENVVAGTA